MTRCSRQKKGTVRYPPDRFQRGRIARETRNDMPMDMRKLVPEEFVVHLLSVVDVGQSLGYPIDFLDQLESFGGCKLE